MTSRHAMGAVYGYYKSNQGSQFGLEFWENNLTNNLEDLRKIIIKNLKIINRCVGCCRADRRVHE